MNNGWVSVKDMLPAVGRAVNVRNSYTTQVARRGTDGRFYAQLNQRLMIVDDVTHWAVIPPFCCEE